MHWSQLFLKAPPSRAVSETLLLGIVFWVGLLLLDVFLPPSLMRSSIILLTGSICMLWCALRLQVLKRPWWQQGIFEVVIGGIVSLVLSSMTLALALVPHGGIAPTLHWKHTPLEVTVLVLMVDILPFMIFRIGVHLWPFWDRLRRKQLLWTLTHAHLTIVALGAALLIVVLVALTILSSSDFSLIVIVTLGLIILGVIVLVAVVPLSVLFSYLVVRRMTPRLHALAKATSGLRGGNYAIRVPVVGEDEVAQLQADFNAMAAELERAMHELEGERDTVAKLLHSRRELIANVSHELRTPMATLRSYLETTLAHWENNPPPTLHHDLQVMEDEVIRLQLLVDDLFTLARAEVGKLTLQCEPTDVGKLVQRIVETRAPLAWQARKVEMVADIPSELPPVVVDPNRLEQVMQNLLHNAVRHTPPGGIVAVVVMEEPEALILQVKDTGEGIPAEDLPRIWERFYQTGSTRTHMNDGTGLGLALVKEWVEAMGGTVAVESVVGEGSCFSIRLHRM